MTKNKELDLLKDNTLTFKAKTFTEGAVIGVPVFFLGALPGAVIAGVLALVDTSNPGFQFTPDVYLWTLAPLLNVLGVWPLCYMEDAEGRLEGRGYKKQKVSYRSALKAWYKVPGFSKKKLMGNYYVKINDYNKDKLHGDVTNAIAPMGEATHEVIDYLISDARGIRLERQIEPTPLMLWNDALHTIDEGFGLKKISI